ncbi:MAG: response regulator [Pseudomonadota bacterium]
MTNTIEAGHVAGRVIETCLIVDDDAFDRDQMKQAIQRQRPDMQTFEFATLSEARMYLRTASADIILLDNRLPDGKGSDLARELRNNPRLSDTPIFVITGDAVSSLDHGVTALSKDDLNGHNLGELLAEFLKARRIARKSEAGQLVEDLGALMDSNLAPAFSRAIRTLRTARAQVTRTAPFATIHALDEVEEIMVALANAVTNRGTNGPH